MDNSVNMMTVAKEVSDAGFSAGVLSGIMTSVMFYGVYKFVEVTHADVVNVERAIRLKGGNE